MSKEGPPLSLINSVGPNILKMDTGWGMLVMKLFKTIWCSRRKRAGRFNVHQANQKNNNLQGIDRVPGYCRSTSVQPELFICNQSSELSGCCRSPVDRRPSPTGSIASTQSQSQLTPSRQLSDGERLKKVILELVDTERTYVKHLNNLLENYLEPLKNASFLSSAEVNALFGNIREIVAFQRLFLQALTEALDMEPAFHKFEHPYEFKNVLFSIGSAFLYYASQFKLYSSFCASHSKAQKVLHPSEGNQALQEFLASRNPRQQHSATLESYLIKPIQRILKYPLLLQQLKALTDPGSDEHRHLVEALKVMEKVAEHINEMQRIHEEYGAIFDHLFRQHQKSSKQVSTSSLQQPIDLSPGDLLYYGGVEWLNISDFLGKIKKGLELHAMCFVFKTAVVFLCKERLRQKKKLMGVPGKNSSSEVEIIRYQVLIPVTEVQVRASSMKDMDSHFLWELIHLKSQLQRRSEKVYHLSNSTSEFRNAFLKTIRQIIRESVRNMNIPANKPMFSGGNSQKPGSTNTLQPQRQAKKKQGAAAGHQSATLQRHSAGQIDYDNLESYDNVPETLQQQQQQRQQRGSIGTGSSSGGGGVMSDGMDELSDSTTKSDSGMVVASAMGGDGGVDMMRSEGEDDEEEEEEEEEVLSSQRGRSGSHSMSSVVMVKSGTLGRTPNHLSLSTTSTLSTGSTGSCARLIQASNQPAHYQPARSHAGSPVWKPRDSAFPSGGSGSSGAGTSNSQTLPRSHKIAVGREDHFHIYEEYGGNIYMSGGKKDHTEEKNQCNSGSYRPSSAAKTPGSAEGPPACVICSKQGVMTTAQMMSQQGSSKSQPKKSTGGESAYYHSSTPNSSSVQSSAYGSASHNSSNTPPFIPVRSSKCGGPPSNSKGSSPLLPIRKSTCGVPYHTNNDSSPLSTVTSSSEGTEFYTNVSLANNSTSSRCSHDTNVSIPYTSNCMASHLTSSSNDRSPSKNIVTENSAQYPPANVVRHRKPRTSKTSSLHINTSNIGPNSLHPSPNYSSTSGSSLQQSPSISHMSSNEHGNPCFPNAFRDSLQESHDCSRASNHHSKYLNTSSNESTSSPLSNIGRTTPYRSWQNSDLMDRTQNLMLDLNNALLNRAKHSSLNTNSSVGDYSNLSDSHSDISFSSSGFSNSHFSSSTASESRYRFQQKSRSLNEDLWLEGPGCYSPKSQRSSHTSGLSNSNTKGNYSFPTSDDGSSTDSLNGAAIGGADGLAMTIDSLLQQLREIS